VCRLSSSDIAIDSAPYLNNDKLQFSIPRDLFYKSNFNAFLYLTKNTLFLFIFYFFCVLIYVKKRSQILAKSWQMHLYTSRKICQQEILVFRL